jgi:hypothetical protein
MGSNVHHLTWFFFLYFFITTVEEVYFFFENFNAQENIWPLSLGCQKLVSGSTCLTWSKTWLKLLEKIWDYTKGSWNCNCKVSRDSMRLCVCPESSTLGRDNGAENSNSAERRVSLLIAISSNVSSEIEFGRLPYQPMRDIPWHSFKRWYPFLQRHPQIWFHLNKNQSICIGQFRHDPEKVRGWYHFVSRETNERALKFQKVITW